MRKVIICHSEKYDIPEWITIIRDDRIKHYRFTLIRAKVLHEVLKDAEYKLYYGWFNHEYRYTLDK